ncbi:adenylate/guanylate cyclase domain-containing protein [Candidatus Bipolaricaulota bacterium]
MDFVNTFKWKDRENGILETVMKPDPRRYDWVEDEGHRYLYDRYDEIFFPEEMVAKRLLELSAGPIGFQPPTIRYAPTYVRDRLDQIRRRLAESPSCDQPQPPSDKSEEFLEALSDHELGFAILAIDLVGSTKLITQLPSSVYSRIIDTLLYECSHVVPQFRGHVLKYTGDGLIAYFPEPSFIIMNDLAIDCAMTLHGLVYAAINPCLTEIGLPTIDVRLGLDSGQATVKVLGSGQTKRHADVIGAAISLASKVQSIARPSGVCMGETLNRNLHVMWREICEPQSTPGDWPYSGSDGQPYMVFRVQEAALNENVQSMM